MSQVAPAAPAASHTHAELIVELTDLALAAPDVPSAVVPVLDRFVGRTAAEGSAYFQVGAGAGAGGGFYHARAAAGAMPEGPAMDAILAHGLPAGTPLMRALEAADAPLFFADTAATPITAGFPDLGVASLAAAPVRDGRGRLLGAFLMHTFAAHAWTVAEAGLFAAVARAMAGLAARLVAEEELLAAREGALRALGLALECRDGETKGHTDRVTALALRLGAEMGLGKADLAALRWGAYLHDVGKLGIPDAILRKPGPLDAAEWTLMREHAALGHAFAAELTFLPPAALDVVRSHHERWDGGGYPRGLAGEAIPLAARVFAVCDVYDALTSARPYKPAWPPADALAEISAQSGRHFDPAAVAAFLRLFAPPLAEAAD